MPKKVYQIRIPEELLELADVKGSEERTDRSTALRQWLYIGAESYVLNLLSQGRVTLSRAAEILEVSIYDLHRIAKSSGVEVGAGSEFINDAGITATKILKKIKK